MRGQGRVFRRKVGERELKVWWLDYGIRGQRHRESSGSTSKKDALEMLRVKIGKRTAGTLVGRPEKVTLADLKKGLEKNYVAEGCSSWGRALQAFAHLDDFFGADALALRITKAAVADYQDARLKAGAARNSARYEVAILSAAFGVAVTHELLALKPSFKLVAAGDKRTGFFETGDFAALVLELPADLAALVTFLYLTGWRRGEGIGLQWAQVNWDDADFAEDGREPVAGANACIRIGEAQTKGKDARQFPIAEFPALLELLLTRWRVRDGLHVFHRQGAPIGDFRKVWAAACKKAGLEGRLVHDLRRTAARDFRKSGVSEGEIMKLAGWKTRSMFDRYNIIDDGDLRRAVARRSANNGTTTAHNGQNQAVSTETQNG